MLACLFADSGFVGVEQRPVALTLRMPSAAQAAAMLQEALGALRAIVSDRPEAVRVAAWAEVAETLKTFETATGFSAPAEVVVAQGSSPREQGVWSQSTEGAPECTGAGA